MTSPALQKETLIMRLTEIYNQLDDMETAMENAFFKQYSQWEKEEMKKIAKVEKTIFWFEEKIENIYAETQDKETDLVKNSNQEILKLELSF